MGRACGSEKMTNRKGSPMVSRIELASDDEEDIKGSLGNLRELLGRHLAEP